MKLHNFFTTIQLRDLIRGIMIMVVGVVIIIILINKITEQDSNNVEQSLLNTNLTTTARIISPQGVDINVYVASTEKQRVDGLSGFKMLPPNTGMLFVFPQMGKYSFWMKDMNFPLDIIWIDESMQIIDQTINAQPQDYPKTYIPQAAAKYVLEIPANTAELYGFSIGKKVFLTYNE